MGSSEVCCGQKGFHDNRIELRSGAPRYFRGSHVGLRTMSIYARRYHGIKRISHRQDASTKRDVRAGCSMRIACTIVSLMMGHDDVTDVGETGDPPDDGTTVLGVLAHDSKLLFGEEVLFEQDLRRNKGFTQIMQQRRNAEGFEAVFRQMEGNPHGNSNPGNTIGVCERKVIGTLEHLQQCCHNAFSHAAAQCLFEQQFRIHFCATVRTTNKVDTPYVSPGQAPCFRHGNTFFIIWVLGIFASPPYTVTV